jgi:ribosomal protein S6--L-glutamate ligase
VRIGVITAFEDSDWHSARLIAEVARQDHTPLVIDPALFALQATERGLYVLAGNRDLGSLDALLIARGMSPDGDAEVQFEAYRVLALTGQPQVNSIEALLAAQDKVRTSCLLAMRGVPTPETVVAQTEQQAQEALDWFGSAVIKPRYGSLGEGVIRADSSRAGHQIVRTILERNGSIYLQRFVETHGEDFRVFVVGGRARAAIRRRARPGEWRTNFAQGGSLEPIVPGAALAIPAQAAARAVGLDYTAVDLVLGPEGPLVLEVNGHPDFEGVFRANGTDLAVDIVRRVGQRAAAFRRIRSSHVSELASIGRGRSGGEGRHPAEWGDAPVVQFARGEQRCLMRPRRTKEA